MTPEPIDWTEEPPLDPEQERRALLRSLHRRQGFGVLFVRCTPNQVDRLVEQVQQELPQKKTTLLTLTEPIDNLFEIVDRRPDKPDLRILFIQGLEKSLEPYIQPGYGGEGDYYKLDTAPQILSHLNQQRENFREHFHQLCFVFLLPRFALKYVIRRAPDFFDWGSGIFEIPTDPDLLADQSSRILSEGDYEEYANWTQVERDRKLLEIRSVLEEMNEDLETQAALLFKQGNIFAASRNYQNAVLSYDEVVMHKPDHQYAWSNRSSALNGLKRYEEAIASCDEALKHKPDDFSAWNNRGDALRNLERYEEAIASYDQALKHKPDFYSAWNNRGTALSNLGRDQEAIVSYDEALKHRPDFHYAWNMRGNALSDIGRDQEAIVSYDEALRHRPDFHYAWSNRGFSLDNLGRYEEAISSFDKTLEIKSDSYIAWYGKASALSRIGRTKEAIESYAKVIEIRPDHATAWHNRALAFAGLNQYDRAISGFRKSIELRSSEKLNSMSYYCLAGSLRKIGCYEEALECCDKAILDTTRISRPLISKAYTLLLLGRYRESIISACQGLITFKLDKGKREWVERRGSIELQKLGLKMLVPVWVKFLQLTRFRVKRW